MQARQRMKLTLPETLVYHAPEWPCLHVDHTVLPQLEMEKAFIR